MDKNQKKLGLALALVASIGAVGWGVYNLMHQQKPSGGGGGHTYNTDISGVVTDAVSKAPVAGAVVSIGQPAGPRTAVTDSQGAYSFTGIADEGGWIMEVRASGYQTYTTPGGIHTHSGQQNIFNFALTQEVAPPTSGAPSQTMWDLLGIMNDYHIRLAEGYQNSMVMAPYMPHLPQGTVAPTGLQMWTTMAPFIPLALTAQALWEGLITNASQITFYHDKSRTPGGTVTIKIGSAYMRSPFAANHTNTTNNYNLVELAPPYPWATGKITNIQLDMTVCPPNLPSNVSCTPSIKGVFVTWTNTSQQSFIGHVDAIADTTAELDVVLPPITSPDMQIGPGQSATVAFATGPYEDWQWYRVKVTLTAPDGILDMTVQ